jgi:catechol 2,3-dioxygenase-like lactoylglutathione lyase family enzyme
MSTNKTCLNRFTILAVTLAAAGTLTTSHAQVAAPSRAGVAMGHLHFIVRDLAANKRFWSALGGVPVNVGEGAADAFRFQGLLVLLSPGTPMGDGTGEAIDHVAFRTRSLEVTVAAVKAAGFKVSPPGKTPNIALAYTPDGYKVELFDVPSEDPRFFPDGDQRDSDWERHMAPMTVPIMSQHIHYYLRAGVESEAKAWYFKMFGGTLGKRLRYEALDLPGINLNFSVSSNPKASPAVPTRGRTLDHIGFEVSDLATFRKALEAKGVNFEAPNTKHPNGVATVSFTDPWGVTIELTEGLRGL